MVYKSFEDYLKDIHSEDYHGTDDDMYDDFVKWSDDIDFDVMCLYADRYTQERMKQVVAEIQPRVYKYLTPRAEYDGYTFFNIMEGINLK